MVIEAIFLFTLVAGVLVMIATMQSTHDERVRDNAIMKTLGASRKQLRKILFTEFFLVGLISSIIATLAANLTGYNIATNLMNMSYQVHVDKVLLSLFTGTLVITITGLLAFRRYHKMSPMRALKYRGVHENIFIFIITGLLAVIQFMGTVTIEYYSK